MMPTITAHKTVMIAYIIPSNLKIIGSIKDNISVQSKQMGSERRSRVKENDGEKKFSQRNAPTINAANVLNAPANPAIIE